MHIFCSTKYQLAQHDILKRYIARKDISIGFERLHIFSTIYIFLKSKHNLNCFFSFFDG